jgi:hypothetical protein
VLVRAAWNQQLVTASLKNMHEKMNAMSTETRKRKPDEQLTDRDVTAERMSALNTLISASAEHAPGLPQAAPVPLTVEQQRMAAALKISAALDAF